MQNDTEDEEETALKTAEVLSHAKQSELQPSEVDRDHAPDHSTKIPQGSTKCCSHQKYKKLEQNHEQLSESNLSTLQRIEVNAVDILVCKKISNR